MLCVLLLFFFAMQGAIPGISPNQASEMTNTPATGLMKVVGIGSQIFVDGAICILAARYMQRLWRFAFALQWAAAIAALAVVSTFWSQDAMTTARRSVPFALATVFGLYLASRFQVSRQIRIVCITMALAAMASVVLAFLFPAIGLESSAGHFGNWQGIFTQKNACGRAMVFATAAVLSSGRVTIPRVLCLLLFLFVLIMSGSRGAWAIEAILLACWAVLCGLERFSASSRTVLMCGALLLGAGATAAAWIYFPLLAGFLGRDATLTGRTAIWQQVWTAVVKHPLLGYGFAAFWQGMKGESYHVILALRFVVFHAHNGFLEIWLELGAAGLLLFVLSYLRAWRKLWPLLRSQQPVSARWMVCTLVLVALYDLDENTLLAFNGLFWILYVVALADIEILAVEQSCLLRERARGVHESRRMPTEAMAVS